MVNQIDVSSLSPVDKERLINEALQANENSKQILAMLGYTSAPKKADPQAKAPDGGPVSNAHMYMKTTMLPTMEVYRLDEEGEPMKDVGPIVINRSSFDEDLHEKIVVEPRRRRRTKTAAPKQLPDDVRLGSQSREQMLTMTMPLLRALPEAGLLAEVPNIKADLVEAILAVRETYSAVA
jgi:hypothetical protein